MSLEKSVAVQSNGERPKKEGFIKTFKAMLWPTSAKETASPPLSQLEDQSDVSPGNAEAFITQAPRSGNLVRAQLFLSPEWSRSNTRALTRCGVTLL